MSYLLVIIKILGTKRTKIWFDLCEPKAVRMLRSLYDRLAPDHNIVITARDFDSTYALLDDWGKAYVKVGKHGGNTLLGKLRSYSDRLQKLIDFVDREKPEILFGLATPEGLRVSFGLQIPNIIFNDEPRSVGVVKLSLPFVNHLIVPEPIPTAWFTQHGISEKNIHKFHGIDEVAETANFVPNPSVLKQYGLIPGKYVLCRPEQTAAQYHMNSLGEGDTNLPLLVDPLMHEYPDLVYVFIPRNAKQKMSLQRHYQGNASVQFYDYLTPIEQFLFHAKLVVAGGGSFTRQSALMNIPSVELFPLGIYPQEQFLIQEGFPLSCLKKPNDNPRACIDILAKYPRNKGNLTRVKILDNPIDLAIKIFAKEHKSKGET